MFWNDIKWSAHGVLEQCLVYYICVQPCITIFISYSHNKSYNDLLLFVYLSMLLQRFYSLILPNPSHINICENGQCHMFCSGCPNSKIGVVRILQNSHVTVLFHPLVFRKSGVLRAVNGCSLRGSYTLSKSCVDSHKV